MLKAKGEGEDKQSSIHTYGINFVGLGGVCLYALPWPVTHSVFLLNFLSG